MIIFNQEDMKKLIQWLARVFNANIVKEKIVVNEIVKTEHITAGVIDGDVTVNGNLLINGNLSVSGSITYKKK